jgi:hemin uptake protein HemP
MDKNTEAGRETKRYLIFDRGQPIPSERLFAFGEEIRILHQGMEYRLRRTRAGKLILTK